MVFHTFFNLHSDFSSYAISGINIISKFIICYLSGALNTLSFLCLNARDEAQVGRSRCVCMCVCVCVCVCVSVVGVIENE